MKRFWRSVVCAWVCAAGAAAGAVAAPFALADDTLVQIALERSGFSVNCIDGQWGRKSARALAAWCRAHNVEEPPTREAARALLDDGTPPYRLARITASDAARLVRIPAEPAAKARLDRMGYETLQEMFAERGHTSVAALARLNPSLAWPNPPVGSVVRLPNVETTNAPPKAAQVTVSLGRLEVEVFDEAGRLVAHFPCSIAADKRNLPPVGEVRVQGIAPHPNYTYTAPARHPGARRVKYIYPAGPNNPVGSAWVGLSLPSYGIHGTPHPETIGRAESHGCFRLANWNSVRLRDMVQEGTRVTIAP